MHVKRKIVWKSVEKNWVRQAERVSKQVTLTEHAVVVLLSLIAGVIFFLFLNTFLLPNTLPVPQTTAINWLVIHGHSLTLDYIRFGLFVCIIPISTVAGWYVLIWRKNS